MRTLSVVVSDDFVDELNWTSDPETSTRARTIAQRSAALSATLEDAPTRRGAPSSSPSTPSATDAPRRSSRR